MHLWWIQIPPRSCDVVRFVVSITHSHQCVGPVVEHCTTQGISHWEQRTVISELRI